MHAFLADFFEQTATRFHSLPWSQLKTNQANNKVVVSSYFASWKVSTSVFCRSKMVLNLIMDLHVSSTETVRCWCLCLFFWKDELERVLAIRRDFWSWLSCYWYTQVVLHTVVQRKAETKRGNKQFPCLHFRVYEYHFQFEFLHRILNKTGETRKREKVGDSLCFLDCGNHKFSDSHALPLLAQRFSFVLEGCVVVISFAWDRNTRDFELGIGNIKLRNNIFLPVQRVRLRYALGNKFEDQSLCLKKRHNSQSLQNPKTIWWNRTQKYFFGLFPEAIKHNFEHRSVIARCWGGHASKFCPQGDKTHPNKNVCFLLPRDKKQECYA